MQYPGPIRFGEDFELDQRSQKLWRAGRVLKLERIPAELLLLLVENNGELVTREQIVERVWGSGVYLDTDNSINGAIRKIRQVLKDDPEHPQFIQTVTGRGYRFIGPVVASQASVDVPEPLPDQSPAQHAAIPRLESQHNLPRKVTSWRLLTMVGAALLLIALGIYLLSMRPHAMVASGGRTMLAVLPFENFTGDASQEYFSDGLTEEMISQLGNLDPAHLGIIARTSVMHYKHTQEPLTQIGKELGVQYLIEGSIRRDSDRVRVTAQLIKIQDQSHIWARQYDRELTNLLALQAEIAQEIADEIQLTLGGHRRPQARQPFQPPKSYEAYDLYLKGRYFWNKRTTQGLRQAIAYFQAATAKDPSFARAYAGLADSYALLGGYESSPQTESMPKARAAALKALELDEGLAEAHTSLALITENYEFDWVTAEKEYRRAIQLNPNYATAHHWYAEYLALLGRFNEALAESERARELDPLSLIISADKGVIFYYARRYDEAIAQFQSVREMDPGFPRTGMIVAAYVEKRQYSEALAELDKWDHGANNDWMWAWRALIYARTGEHSRAKVALEKLQESYRRGPASPDPMLWAYVGLHDREDSFIWLEKAFQDHSNALTALKVNPGYDWLRDDPRFQTLMRRVRLAP
jgi:TolB-like protein/DNA-binding winged helix-turn-helix (wHTH) protein/Tfp pilus assembly protein PilF